MDTPEGQASIKYELILYSTLEWKLSEFFRAIGQKKVGHPLRPRWNEGVGARGRARFKTRTYIKTDGAEGKANDVVRFYDFDEEAAPASPVWKQEKLDSGATPWSQGRF